MVRRPHSQTQAVRQLLNCRAAPRAARNALRAAAAGFESLEARRLLSVAPTTLDDFYELGPDGKISVDVTPPSPVPEQPLPPLPAFDEGRFVRPAVPDDTPVLVRGIVGPGQSVTEPAWFTVGEQAGSNEEVMVKEGGSWRVSNWLEAGSRGHGIITVTQGAHGTVVIT